MLTAVDPVWREVGTSGTIGLDITDDGTYIIFTYDSQKIFKIRKSDGQFYIAGGIDVESSL